MKKRKSKIIFKTKTAEPQYKRVQRVFIPAIKAVTNLDVSTQAGAYFTYVRKLIRCKGLPSAITRLKQIHHSALHSLLNQQDPGHPYLSTDNDGFPTVVKKLKSLGNTREGIQAINCLLSYYRFIRAPINPDFSAITEAGVELEEDLVDDLLDLIPEDWEFDLSDLRQPQIKFQSSNGPNGQATLAAAIDLATLPEELYGNIIFLAEAVESEDFLETIEELRDNVHTENKGDYHSRLGVIPEGGGKSRIFAMCDYWTQMVLEPLHHQLASILQKISMDCTFNQGKGVQTIKEWTLDRNDLFCYDLTSASDRIPLLLQERILETLCGDGDYARNWKELVANRQFRYKGKPYTWTVGQPLGAYSSWPSFTIAHHLMVMLAAKRAGTKPEYFILGDDIVIAGTAVASEYKAILTQLGIEINFGKSMAGNAVEFAKRHFYKGSEVSSFPITLTSALVQDPILITEVVNQIVDRTSLRKDAISVDTLLWTLSRETGTSFEQLKVLTNNPITGKPDIVIRHPSPAFPEVERVREAEWPELGDYIYQFLYGIVKYRYLIVQYSILQRGEDEFMSKLSKIPLPGINPDYREMHPIWSSLGHKYKFLKGQAHKEIGKFWSRQEISRSVLPEVFRPSVDELTRSHFRRVKHNARIILELWKASHEVYPLIQQEQALNKEVSITKILGSWYKSTETSK